MSGEIQYIADSLLIEKVAKLDKVLTKEGSLVSDIFSGVGSAVSSFVKSNIDSSSPEALSKSVLHLLAPGMLFRVHPLLAFLYYIAKEYGYDITGIISNIVSKISDKIKSGEPIDPSEINSAALSTTASLNTDLFYELRRLEKNGSLVKMARRGSLGGKTFGQKGAPILHNLFGFLSKSSKSTGHNLLAGFVAWFIKTILLSAGLLAIGGGAKKLVEKGKDKLSPKSEDTIKPDHVQSDTNKPIPVNNIEQGQTSQNPASSTSSTSSTSSSSSSSSSSSPSSTWYVPILGGSVKNTILEWAKEFYPELSGYEDIIKKTPSFNNTVNEMSKYMKGPYLVLPGNFKSRDEIARQFAPDVKKEIKLQKA